MIDYWRQLDLVSPADLAFDVSIIGAGGLGSSIALALAKMGCPRISILDDDRVEPHNLPNQLFRLRDIGRHKAEALAENLREYVEAEVVAIAERVEAERAFSGVVVSAVDSMASRQTIWTSCVRYRAPVSLYLDARLGGEVSRVLSLMPAHPIQVRAYEDTLYTDAEASEDPCTAQATIYTTFGVAALVANQVKRFARGEPVAFDQILDFATSTLISSE